VRQAAGKAGCCHIAPCRRGRRLARIHHPPDLRRQDEAVAPVAAQRRAATVLGEAVAVVRRGVEQRDAGGKGGFHGGDGRGVVEPRIEIAERRGAEAEDGDGEVAASKRACRQAHGGPP